MRVAILASGNGTNFEVLAQHFKNNDLPGELALLFCNHPDAPVMKELPDWGFRQKALRSNLVGETGIRGKIIGSVEKVSN